MSLAEENYNLISILCDQFQEVLAWSEIVR